MSAGHVLAIGALASAAWAQVTARVSVGSSGIQADYGADLPSPGGSTVSADGNYAAFFSAATNLVPNDTNGWWDVFVRERASGTTERISVDSAGIQGNGFSGLYGVVISNDGRYVVFESRATNLVASDTNGARDIFLRDRWSATTERVSIDSSGIEGNADSIHPAISADGRFLAFFSDATNLVPGDTNGQPDVFVRDLLNGTTEVVSVSFSGLPGNGISDFPSLSADGRFVAFASDSSNLVGADTNNQRDVFVRDRQLGLTFRVSRNSSGAQANSYSAFPSISGDGRYVAFQSHATNLVGGDTNGDDDIFVHDRLTATTERVSVAQDGSQADSHSNEPCFSADHRYLAFHSPATNLLPSPLPGTPTRVYVRDQLTGTIELVSNRTDGSSPSNGGCATASISVDGRYVSFRSNSTDLVPGDTNGAQDVFIHDRFAAGFSSLCDPGQNGVIDCPCGNPPASVGRGCDNSTATGGAALSASGLAYLSTDTLAFATTDERPSSTSILLQGDASIATGTVFGQGVRCAGGQMKRLYVKSASSGSITAPDFAAGDPSVSARSLALGVALQAGTPYFYLVYYRDPVVLGGCSAPSTFNSTQTGSVTYWP